MTLVELLVVIVLISILVATAIPVISPGGDNRKLREASRGLNAYLQGAQARAIETGRPFGVAFRRLSASTDRSVDNAVCSLVEYVEVPPWYSGFDATSAVRIARSPFYNPVADPGALNPQARDETDDIGPLWVQFVNRKGSLAALPPGWGPDLVPPRFLRPGDTLEVHGQRYTLLDRNDNNTSTANPTLKAVSDSAGNSFFPGSTAAPSGLVTLLAVPEGMAPSEPIDRVPTLAFKYDAAVLAAGPPPANATYWTEPAPYRILRQPVPAGGEALELPTGIAIDLQASVFGTGDRVYSPHVDYDDSANAFFEEPRSTDLLLMFSPQGGIDRVHGVVNTSTGVTEPPTTVTSYLALCVGRRELIPAKPQEVPSKDSYKEPIDLYRDVVQPGLSETEARELTDQYNWLNLESRWVIVAGTTGAVSTVETSGVFTGNATGQVLMREQLGAALDAVPRRVRAGGR